ncbi:MAG TPA: S-methyl-5-thioribose-1-phosphate isomerase [Chthoniobacterales bacterium]|nr:S-methyl-5-thioribose-1-phosphate isomerase [Chthoniobacterales bacterium]
MNVDGQPYRTIWLDDDCASVRVIDQTRLPHRFEIARWRSVQDVATGIRDMVVRGAPLIGAAAAYGMALAMQEDPGNENLRRTYDLLFRTRPTAVNLRWALDLMRQTLLPFHPSGRVDTAYTLAGQIAEEDVQNCSAIGDCGRTLIEQVRDNVSGSRPINILTHCNAGWLATVDWGTALAPIYKAFNAGISVHVWVDETRPRNQGASLTAWELGHHGVPHTVIADNAGGHLMQHGLVDLCIVGSDRTTASGDVANKIGTYLKALAAHDNDVPFYVALPVSTIDWTIDNGVRDIPIEKRAPDELTHISGTTDSGEIGTLRLTPKNSPAANYAFDVTPRHLVTALITEHGVFRPVAEEMVELKKKATKLTTAEANV